MFNPEKKKVQTVNYITELLGGVADKIQLMKLIWLADRLHLRIYGRPVTDNTYFAMKHGPVPSETKSLIEKPTPYVLEYLNIEKDDENREVILRSKKATDKFYLSESDIEILNKIISEFGSLNKWKLRDISHEFPEWLRFEKQIVETNSSYPIDMADFFEPDRKSLSIFNQDSELLEFSKEDYFYKIPQA